MILRFFLFLLLFSFGTLPAQSPYHLDLKNELIYAGSGGVLTGLGYYLKSTSSGFTLEELRAFEKEDINGFDRFATRFNSATADKASDYFAEGSFLLPGLLLLGRRSRRDFGTVAVLYTEAFLWTTGLTQLCKSTFRRPRPYVFDDDQPEDGKLTSNARASFLSGHTSNTALNTFFVARLFSDYYPDSPWKPVVWIGAAAIPAMTGYLRIRGGQHYPTDVLAGYALGAVIGVMVPKLHREWNLNTGSLRLQMGFGGGRICWVF